MRAGESLYTIELKSACREPGPSLAGLDQVPLSKIGTGLLASLGSKGKIRNSLACLRNAGSYFVVTYCSEVPHVEIWFPFPIVEKVLMRLSWLNSWACNIVAVVRLVELAKGVNCNDVMKFEDPEQGQVFTRRWRWRWILWKALIR